ncbi:MAG: SLC13 family permease [Candidatus Micrarchaeota archaeon]|nr:SLC13 family permease [Candidatus Micrarchaeota archaeon]
MILPNSLPLSIAIVLVIFLATTLRNFLKIEIWKLMLLGAIFLIISNQISIQAAFNSIDLEVLIFLSCMFIFGSSLEESGLLFSYTGKLLNGRKHILILMMLFAIISGISAALFLNDTIAIIGTSIALLISHQLNINSKIMLYLLAFSITIGSVLSPIGNPQNFLIAKEMKDAFSKFFTYLTIPTLFNLIITTLIVYYWFRKYLPSKRIFLNIPVNIFDRELAKSCKISIFLLILIVILKLLLHVEIPLFMIGLITVIPIFLISSKRIKLIKHIDWHTLIFFASMFIVMKAAWNSNYFQQIIEVNNIDLTSLSNVFVISIIASQLLSNVPLVLLYLPFLINEQPIKLIALAAGSTIAGNLSVLGAASNVIIIQQAERKKEFTFDALEFFKLGIFVTLVNTVIYLVFLNL